MGNLSRLIFLYNFRPAPSFQSIQNRNDRLSQRSRRLCFYLLFSPFAIENWDSSFFLQFHTHTHIARYASLWIRPAQSKTNQAEPYNLLHRTGITPTHLKNLASFQGSSSSALAGLSQRGWSVTCGKNIELIRFNKTKFHTHHWKAFLNKGPVGVTASSPSFQGKLPPSSPKLSSSLRCHERPAGCRSRQTGEVVESGTNG